MSNKPVPPVSDAPTSASEPQRTKIARRRFAEGETSIVRLDELLRQRAPQDLEATTVRAPSAPELEATRIARPKGAPALSEEDHRLISATQPRESQTAIRRREESLRSSPGPRPRPTDRLASRPTADGAEGLTGVQPRPHRVSVQADETRALSRSEILVRSAASGPKAAPQGEQQTQLFSAAAKGLGAKPADGGRPATALEAARAQAEQESHRARRAVPPPLPPAPGAERPVESRLAPNAPLTTAPLGREVTVPSVLPDAGAPALPPVDEVAAPPVAPRPPVLQRRIANHTVAFFTCKGGAGCTTLALNSSYVASGHRHTSCVVDMDLQLGDVLAAFGLSPKFSFAQAIQAASEGQPVSKGLLPTHACGMQVLSQVGNLNDLEKISPEPIGTLLESLRQQFDSVVVDGLRDFGDNALAVLDQADLVAVVLVQEVLAIRRARWAYSILQKIGFAAADLCIIVNRYQPQSEITLASLQAMFTPSEVVPIVYGGALVTRSLDRGLPLSEASAGSAVAQSVAAAGEYLLYGGEPPALPRSDDAAEDSSLMGRLFKRKERPSP